MVIIQEPQGFCVENEYVQEIPEISPGVIGFNLNKQLPVGFSRGYKFTDKLLPSRFGNIGM